MQEKAIEKITAEFNDKKPSGRIQQVIAQFVSETVCDFCNESEPFAQAVMVEDKTLNGCLDFIAQKAGQAISDAEVARMAARYFVPEAEIKSSFSLVMPGDRAESKIINIFDII